MNSPSLQSPAWHQAFTLRERAQFRPLPTLVDNWDEASARQFVEQWRTDAAFPNDDSFRQRLATDSLSEGELGLLISEPAESVRARHPLPPAWLNALLDAFSTPHQAPTASVTAAVPTSFLKLLEPLLHRAARRLARGLGALTEKFPAASLDADAIQESFFGQLSRPLWWMINRTLVLELNVARLQELLPGETPEDRFAAFTERLRQPEVALALFEEYPVLARVITETLESWVSFRLEALAHVCEDWTAMQKLFRPETDLGRLTNLHGSPGDTHRGGRSVQVAEFSSGLKLVYKPRSLAVDVHFQELLGWLNARGGHAPFKLLRVLDRESHGWVEFVPANPCESVAELARFYERQGGLLALLYALEATDFHCENLIASGEHPVLVDLESLFHPRLQFQSEAPTDQIVGDTMAYSVLRVGLLPQRVPGAGGLGDAEISGLGGAPGQLTPYGIPTFEDAGTDAMRLVRKRMEMLASQNRPSLSGAEVNVLDYAPAEQDGFSGMYQLLLQHRDELLAADGPLARFADVEVRVILRGTESYSSLLHESFHPDVLRNALDRDRLFDRLWLNVPQQPWLARVAAAERRDLWQGDIPMFTTRACSTAIWTAAGEQIPNFFKESGLDLVRRRVAELCMTDLERQRWFVRASLCTLAETPAHQHSAAPRGARQGGPAEPAQLLAAARAVGDRLETLALRDGGHANWIGLTLVNETHWTCAPLGLDLYGGLPGLALFLAYLGDVTGEERYTRLAREALASLRKQWQAHAHRITSLGAFDGQAGMIYLLAHLGQLWNEPGLLAEAEAVVEAIPPLIEKDTTFDIINGAGGAIAALLSLHCVTLSPRALEVAARCGEWLVRQAQTMPVGAAWKTTSAAPQPLAGFSHGAAGIAWALLELASRTGVGRFRETAIHAIAYERSLFSPSAGNWSDLRLFNSPAGPKSQPPSMIAWCHGAPGVGLARANRLPLMDDAATREEISIAVHTTLARGFGSNHCLCHGDLGNLELLLVAGRALNNPSWQSETRHLAGQVLHDIQTSGWRCSVPNDVETPGLMNGLAGMGWQLLRLSNPERVPSILLLESPRVV